MKTRHALLISAVALAGACGLFAWARRPALAPAARDDASLAESVRRIDARLERMEEAIARLSPRGTGSPGERPAAAPSRSAARAPDPREAGDWAAALARLEARLEGKLEQLRESLAASSYREGTQALVFEPPVEEAPPELQVRLEARLVQEGERLAVKVYWSIAAGASSASEQDWVGLFLLDAPDRQYVRWQYTKGLPAGEATLQLPETGGVYEARYFFKSGYARVPGASGPVQVPQLEPPPAASDAQTKE